MYLGTGTLVPENLGQVVASGCLKRILKHLHFLHEHQMIVVGRHLSAEYHTNQTWQAATLTVASGHTNSNSKSGFLYRTPYR